MQHTDFPLRGRWLSVPVFRDLYAGGRRSLKHFALSISGRDRATSPSVWSAWRRPSRVGRENVYGAFEVVGDGGELNLDGGFGETSPSHSAQTVAALPCPEDLLDPAPHPMDRLVPFFELAQRFLFVAAPHAVGDDPRYAALCTHGITEVIAAIGTVGKLSWTGSAARSWRGVCQ